MSKYEPGDIVTYYFITNKENNRKFIHAWTDNKDLAKFYLEFHKCKNFTLKSITDTIEAINEVLNSNFNDEIQLVNITIRNPKNKYKAKSIMIPATENEMAVVNQDANTYMSSHINYSFINSAIDYLKPKYQELLRKVFLQDVIRTTIHGKSPSKILQQIEIDELAILFRSFPNNFGC